MEKTFPRLIHLLAHHTDFSKDENDLDDMVTYLTFYLECVGTADNYALFFHLAQRIKQARDALDPDSSEVKCIHSILLLKCLAFIHSERFGTRDH